MQLRPTVFSKSGWLPVVPNVSLRVLLTPARHKNIRRQSMKLSCKREMVDSFSTEMKEVSPVAANKTLDSTEIYVDWRSELWISALCVGGFLVIGYLVCGGADQSNALLALDHSVQEWVVANMAPSVRTTFFAKVVSNTFIQLNLIAGPLLMLIHALSSSKRRFILPGMYALFFYAGTGSHRLEGMLVHVLKAYFHRSRPILGMRSPSFPSGHAMATAFLTGALLFVVLPVTCKYFDSKRFPAMDSFLTKLDSAKNTKWAIWVLSWVCCSAGRIGSNAHWLSDTIAGCLIGIALTYIFKAIHDLFADSDTI